MMPVVRSILPMNWVQTDFKAIDDVLLLRGQVANQARIKKTPVFILDECKEGAWTYVGRTKHPFTSRSMMLKSAHVFGNESLKPILRVIKLELLCRKGNSTVYKI